MSGQLHVRDGGLSTSVQDIGRSGVQSLGIPVSGALDPFALRLANALVGNAGATGALEIRFAGPTLTVEADRVRVALVGTAVPIEIRSPEPRRVPPGQSVTLARGTVFRVGATPDSGASYLAVAGEFALPAVFGSQSTYAKGGIGGLAGRALSAGDVLPLVRDAPPDGSELTLARPYDGGGAGPIRVVLGPQADYFTQSGLRTFLSGEFRVSSQTDRMGLRLDGPAIEHSKGFNIPSDGIVNGSIQVPGTGQPIVLLADRQTTGGYPKIASVISTDIRRLARLGPGAAVTFKAVDIDEAERHRRDSEADLVRAIAAIAPVGNDAAAIERALWTENLISDGDWLSRD